MEELATASVSQQVDYIGTGYYHLILVAGCGCVVLSESMEMGGISALNTALSRTYMLTDAERATMAGVTFSGCAVGTLTSGFLCDMIGRRSTLLFSNLMIGMAMLATALLPVTSGTQVLLGLRFFSGVVSALGIPASMVLVVECTPRATRAKMVFGVMLISYVGYILDAIGLNVLMPMLGESEEDNWRMLCILIGSPAILSMPIIFMLAESPAFLVTKKCDTEGALEALRYIAHMNGGPRPYGAVLHAPEPNSRAQITQCGGLFEGQAFNGLILLMFMDGCRAFFTVGSSYLWKDLFALATSTVSVTPAALNVVASLSPILGLLVGERLLFLGVIRVLMIASLIGATSTALLSVNSLRVQLPCVIILVLSTKLVYGPLATCFALIKAESFPTQTRAVAFAYITVVAKTCCISAPVLIEELKASESGAGWSEMGLRRYLLLLSVTVLISGCLAFLLPLGSSGAAQHEASPMLRNNDSKESEYGSVGTGSQWDVCDGESLGRADSELDNLSIPGERATPRRMQDIGTP